MKIITQGTVAKAWWVGLRTTCSKCNAVIEFDASDTPGQSMNTADFKSSFAYSRCPCCSNQIKVSFPVKAIA